MVQKRETKAINKLCVREILSLSFVCGAYFFEFRGRKFVLVSRIISIGGGTCKFAPEAGKARMRTAFFTRVGYILVKVQHVSKSKILGGIFKEVRMSAGDASIPAFGPGFSLV